MKSSRALWVIAAVGVIAAVAVLFLVQPRLHADQAKRYELKGAVVSVEADELTVDMEAIPGYMDAMTMPYRVADVAVLKTLKKGDRIRAIIVVQNEDEHLENIKVVSEQQNKASK
jgi:protein SCO1/2